MAHRSRPQFLHLPGVRFMGGGLDQVDPAVVRKARTMSLWVGALAGLFGSLVGVGGGVLISPIIANACRRLPQRVISGTSLAAVVAIGGVSGSIYVANGVVDLTSVLVVAAAAVFTSPLGAKATSLVDCARLRQATGYWLLFVSPLVPLKSYIFSLAAPEAATLDAPDLLLPAGDITEVSGEQTAGSGAGERAAAQAGAVVASTTSLRELRGQDAVLGVVGGLAGFASGLLGIGGGSIVTPGLALLTGMPQISVVGTSLAAMVVPAVFGLAQHQRLGNVDWVMAAALAGGSLGGSLLGSNVALNVPPFALEMAFALGMAYLGHRTLQVARATASSAPPKVTVPAPHPTAKGPDSMK